MKDLGDMSPEELREWAEDQTEEARAKFADAPVPRPNWRKIETSSRWFEGLWETPWLTARGAI